MATPRAAGSFVVRDPDGLHARPCARVAKCVEKLDADVRIEFGGRAASARSVLEMLRLEVPGGAEVCVTAAGRDARDAVQAVGRAIESA